MVFRFQCAVNIITSRKKRGETPNAVIKPFYISQYKLHINYYYFFIFLFYRTIISNALKGNVLSLQYKLFIHNIPTFGIFPHTRNYYVTFIILFCHLNSFFFFELLSLYVNRIFYWNCICTFLSFVCFHPAHTATLFL